MQQQASIEEIRQFMDITRCTEQQARHFLESGQDLESALSLFYETGGIVENVPQESSRPTAGEAQPTSQSSTKSSGPKYKASSARVATFGDLGKNQPPVEDSDEEDEGQDYFAGGEKSGVMMRQPGKKDKNPADLVKDIMNMAAKQPNFEDDSDEEAPVKPNYFTGKGNRLGDETSGSAVVEGDQKADDSNQKVVRYMTFWENGFSVGDEPTDHEQFYDLNDPQNQQLLEQIKTGVAPLHILNVKPGQKVSVNVAHEHSDWTPPPKKRKAFEGEGRTLGGVASASSSLPGSFPTSASLPPSSGFTLDPSRPSTSLQIRLSDGTRMVAKFNHDSTIQDLYNVVRAARAGADFVLMTTFPATQLTNMKQTLADAKLLNAAVVQKMV